MIETINIQSVWSPPGKEYPKVITTPEQAKFHLYQDQSELTQHLKVGSVTTIDCFDTTNKQGKPIRRIQNVIIDGKPIIPQKPELEAPKSDIKPQKQYGRDEDRTDQRTFVMEVGDDLRAGLIDKTHPFVKARETILATWVNLKIETKPEPKLQPATTSAKVEALRQPNIVDVEDLRIKLKELFKQKTITGKELVAWGITKWADMDTLPQDKLLEIARAIEKI